MIGGCFVLFFIAVGGLRYSLLILSTLIDERVGEPVEEEKHDASLPLSAIAALLLGVLLFTALFPPSVLIVGPLALILLFPAPIGFLVSRFGWTRWAYRLTRISTIVWRLDPRGGALFVGAIAALRSKDLADLDWLEAKLPTHRPVTPAALAAAGLLAVARGLRDHGAALVDLVPWFDPQLSPNMLTRTSNEFRAVDAARTGNWKKVSEIGDSTYARTRATRTLSGVAKRLLHEEDAPSDEWFESMWRNQPKIAAFAQSRFRELKKPSTAEPAALTLDDAVSAHATAVANPSEPTLTAAAVAWAAVLPGLDLTARAEALQASPTLALHHLKREVREELKALAASTGCAINLGVLGGDGPTLREDRLTKLELAGQRLRARIAREDDLAPLDEAREWASLMTAYEAGVEAEGESFRRVAFRPMYLPLCDLSVRLYNVRNQRWLSNAITRWLLHHAIQAGDARAEALQRKNLQVGKT